MELHFLVQGSETEPYRVMFRKEGSNFTATCTCRGGEMGQVCKHRTNLLKGETDSLVGGDSVQLAQLPKMFAGTDLERAYEKLVEAEAAVEMAKSEYSKRKQALARAMND
jgi:uncharacterized Zn finger protein